MASALIAVTVATVTTVDPAPAHAVSWTLVARWEMDEPAGGVGCTSPPTMLDDSGYRSPANGVVSATGVVLNGAGPTCATRVWNSGHYTFRGWREVAPDPFANVAIAADAAVRDAPQVVVRHQDKLTPGMRSFKYVMRFKPANVWRSPVEGGAPRWLLPIATRDATYNMVQKGGWNAQNGGQVKIELIGNEAVRRIDVNGVMESRQTLGLVRCMFRTDDGAQTAMVYSLVPANYGSFANKIECGIDRSTNKAFITTFEDSSGWLPAPLTNQVDLPAGFGAVSPLDDMYIAHKPGSSDPLDMYAGDIRYLRLFVGNE